MPNDAELIEDKRGPGRPRTVREEDEALPARRGVRASGGGSLTSILSVPEEKLDRKRFEYRWIVDEGQRLHNLTVNDNYDIMSADMLGLSKSDDRSDAYRARTGMKADGSGPQYEYLCRKPRVYAEEDRAVRQKANDEIQVARVKADEAAVLKDKGRKISESKTLEGDNR